MQYMIKNAFTFILDHKNTKMCSPVLDANDVSLIIIEYIKMNTFCTRFELKIDVVMWST